MGPTVRATLERAGFAPRGGGVIAVEIMPVQQLQCFTINERGALLAQRAEVLLAHLPAHIAQRELAVLQQQLGYDTGQVQVKHIDEAYGPGNVAMVMVQSEHITECFCAFGRPGKPAEQVAQEVVNAVRDYLHADVPVGVYLADQLLLPMALAGGGSFITLAPSRHTQTNAAVIEKFLGGTIQLQQAEEQVWQVRYIQQSR
jgi:RNA 3'-terminal phosphate cyclase (ATP)